MVDQLHWNCEVDTDVEDIDHDKMLKDNVLENMLDLFEEKEICAILRGTFVTRAADIALHARKAGATEDMGVGAGEEFLRGLEEWERKLFKKAHDGTKGTKEWMEGVNKKG